VSNGIPEDLAGSFEGSLSNVAGTTLLNCFCHGYQFRRFDLRHRTRSKEGQDEKP
jgi:hypothetical protein